MINLNHCPRTDHEAIASRLLTEVARIGTLYYELFDATPTNAFDYAQAELSLIVSDDTAKSMLKTAREEFDVLHTANRHAQDFVRSELISAIDEFIEACDEVKADERTRNRNEILKSEGWQLTTEGWKHGKTIVKPQ